MRYIYLAISLALLLFVAACNQSSSKDNNVDDVSLANYDFRNDVLLRMNLSKDTLLMMDTVLNKLDARGVSFPKFIAHAYYELSDSVSVLAEKKFAKENLTMNIKQQDFYHKFHYEELSKAINNYELSMGIDEKLSTTIEYIFVSYDEIKAYCNNWREANKLNSKTE
jgi:hypothetical protein